jgi:hypothetical protein
MANLKTFLSNSENINTASGFMDRVAEFYDVSVEEIEKTINSELSNGDIGQEFINRYNSVYKEQLHSQATSLREVAKFIGDTGNLFDDVTNTVLSQMKN